MDEEGLEYLNQLEQELNEQTKINRSLHNAQTSLYGQNTDEGSIIKWQLNLQEELDRIYHLLKGDKIVEDEKGNIIYKEQDEENLKPFNEFGVQLLMNVMSFYLNRNTILSNYDEETINLKVYDFSIEISDMIFNRYEEMMMTTTFNKEFKKLFGHKIIELTNGRLCVEYNNQLYHISKYMIERTNMKIAEHMLGKIKFYPMIIRALVDSVHSAYLRALHGGERGNLRTAITITQSDMTGRNVGTPTVSQPSKRGLNPLSWFRK